MNLVLLHILIAWISNGIADRNLLTIKHLDNVYISNLCNK